MSKKTSLRKKAKLVTNPRKRDLLQKKIKIEMQNGTISIMYRTCLYPRSATKTTMKL
jgi:hypothetical protein